MKSVIRLGLILMLFTAAAAGLLAFTNEATKGRIAEQERAAQEAALTLAMPAATSFDPADDLLASYREAGQFPRVQSIWIGRANGQAVGLVVKVTPVGYGGPVIALVGIGSDGRSTGMTIINAAQETPGLGANILHEWFQKQFVGKEATRDLVVVKRPPQANNEVQAITAATISSNAVTDGVNEAFDLWASLWPRVSEGEVSGQ
ncbi:MAG: RnfABCDGE type electron transport complex subunit G [Bacillota bacterium]